MATWEEDAAKIMRKRGYLVFGSNTEALPGQVIRHFVDSNGCSQQHPFRVVRKTTRADFIAQVVALGGYLSDDDAWKYYHVVETD